MTSFSELLKKAAVTHEVKSHEAPADFPAWIQTLSDANTHATKTFVIKPKNLKGAEKDKEVYLVAVLSAKTDANPNAVAKAAGAKEGRVVGEDIAEKLFQVSRKDVTPFHLVNVEDKSTIKFLIDATLLALAPTDQLGFRATDDSTVAVKQGDFLKFAEGSGIAFETLTLAESAPSGGKPVVAKKEATKKDKPASGGKGLKQGLQKHETGAGDNKEILIGLTVKKDEDFSTWYQQVLTRTEMLDYYDVSGCYIIRPWAYSIWKGIQRFFGDEIEKSGVEDCYFPMFVSEKCLNREKDHVEGFSPEVAWVTRAGQSDLAEPIAVRPTSETVMYPYYASWIRSHRDLPLRLNQWCNVVRWEFKHPQPFLRTREFLWQEGHTAFATKEESDKEVREILELYRQVYEDLLAVPVVPGKKSEKEKFAGGLYTTTVEGFIPTTGRAIQGATSHCLGQNFSKMFEIMIENEDKERVHVWQNSWGLTTRTIGVMVMVHGDDKGLVLPPRVASIQAIVIPVGITAKTTDEERNKLYEKAAELVQILQKAGVRAKSDVRDNYTPGWKYNHWELRGVPVRLEVGPKDVAKNSTRAVIRFDGSNQQLSVDTIATDLPKLLTEIQANMFAKAKAVRDKQLVRLETWDKFVDTLNQKCLILTPWCEREVCEDEVKENSARQAVGDEEQDEKAPSMGAKTLCIPFKQPEDGVKEGVTKCFACGENAKSYTMWGRSY
ncbi:hypothetical protein DFS34DRAFT_652341 [Phlyctochytrium arcticum]|nr:hypothetical protein DFS34DRAFT_652341 [Phlyctochytrium arcticum]